MKIWILCSQWVTRNFTLLALIASALAYLYPPILTWVMPHIPLLLGIVMFGMGLTLSLDDFKILGEHPKAVLIGVVSQFIIMPCVAYILAKALHLPADIAIGVILVGACPGGTASNVVTYLARGDVALSVAVTSITTLLAPLATPAIFYVLAQEWLEISAWAMLVSIVQVVLLPIALGVLLHRYFAPQVAKIEPILPLISVLAIVILIGGIVGNSKARISEVGWLVFGVVILHNGLGLLLGFLTARWLGLPFKVQKTLAIEVGMQNSGLAANLATKVLMNPAAAVPAAIFSLWHNLSGSILANYWRNQEEKSQKNTAQHDA
ncbi:MAG: bile acid:sodium symporter family protein [Cardiobacteriaceae bacterium]|nr:bile acid:sodium symporter family protein [Cardiobacteriaceae bacterium]